MYHEKTDPTLSKLPVTAISIQSGSSNSESLKCYRKTLQGSMLELVYRIKAILK